METNDVCISFRDDYAFFPSQNIKASTIHQTWNNHEQLQSVRCFHVLVTDYPFNVIIIHYYFTDSYAKIKVSNWINFCPFFMMAEFYILINNIKSTEQCYFVTLLHH